MYNIYEMHNRFILSVVEEPFKIIFISPKHSSGITTRKYFMPSEYIYILITQFALGVSVRRSYKVSNYN